LSSGRVISMMSPQGDAHEKSRWSKDLVPE
jgi:hypothetical protein